MAQGETERPELRFERGPEDAGLDRVLEVDTVSRAARIQAGVLGPALETQLRPLGLTLRHFPQSFEFSTLGGWIATRSGGHFATLYTHIDDFVESLRVVTPTGTIASRRLPGSGAGPSPDRLFLGSEGTLGVITEAWMRLQDRPRLRASASVRFRDFGAGAAAVRALGQAGLYPSNCRLLDPGEAIKVFFKQVPEMALATQAREQIRVGTGILAYVAAREVIKTNGMGYMGPEDYEGMTDLVMKYLAKESDQRPDVPKMMTNQFVGDHKPSPVEWDQMQANAQEFRTYLS